MPSVSVPPLIVPSANVSVVLTPVPMASVLLAVPAEMSFCCCARALTATE